MSSNTHKHYAYSETDIHKAIAEFKLGKYTSIRRCVDAHSMPESTLRHHLSGRTSRSNAHEYRQILSNAEETTLVRWITHLTKAGFPAPPALAIQMTNEVRRNRFQLMHAVISYPRPIGKS